MSQTNTSWRKEEHILNRSSVYVLEVYFENVNQKLKKNELILTDELKLLLHLCQSADDMVTAKSAIYR